MADKYKQDISIEVLVGLFMFVVLIALGVFTIVLSQQNFFHKKYPLTVLFERVGGLREGDQVFLRGTKVGVIKSTYIEGNQVVVHTDLEVPVEFREGYKVEVMASSMLGGKMLKLYEGPLAAEPLPKNTPILGEPPIDILEELGIAVAGIKDMANDVAAGNGTLGKLINDDSMYDEMQAVLENLNEVSDRLVNGKGTVGKLLAEDDALYQDLQGSLANLHRMTEKINSGQGTLGKLMEDDQIYMETQKLLEELRAAIDDMRETSPVTTFSTVFFGAF
ncbi:MAG: MCE family protein [Kiritimatiellales bacterium]|nr:MCE family protein [Kiritimatiellota bacterium]MBL7012132.1 MCE family protein [Kiritimatiellales bacterium]